MITMQTESKLMQIKEDEYDVGVIVGRFQLDKLHSAHKALIDFVVEKHHRVIILLGTNSTLSTRNNPLSWGMRANMINQDYPDILCLPIQDRVSDELWSKDLDEKIRNNLANDTAVLYGGRDSFIPHYTGKFETRELQAADYEDEFSATRVRENIAKAPTRGSEDFRAGVIWAVHNQFPKVYPTVDVAIFNKNPYPNHYEIMDEVHKEPLQILLGRKPDEKKYCLIGGFADPNNDSYERDAKREAREETGLEVSEPVYVGSYPVSDWRYRDEVDQVKTLLFTCYKIYGGAKANDDIEEVKWFELEELDLNQIVPNHVQMLADLKEQV